MKKFIILIMAILISSICFAEKILYENGNLQYEGEVVKNLPNGQGKLYYKNSALKYEGEFKNGELDGNGKLYYLNGKIQYKGEFKESIPTGNGEFFSLNGAILREVTTAASIAVISTAEITTPVAIVTNTPAAIVASSTTMVVKQQETQLSEDEKKAMFLVNDGIKFFKLVGKNKAFDEFNNPKGQFVEGELYIFAVDFENILLAHPTNKRLVGADVSSYSDSDGVFLFAEMTKKVRKNGDGWVNYRWNNPITKKIENKTSYVKLIEGTNIYLGCGIYKK